MKPTLLALREEALDEDDVQHAHADIGVVDERHATLQELQHQRVVHLVEEDAQRDKRVRQQDGRGLRLGVIPYPKPHGEVGEDLTLSASSSRRAGRMMVGNSVQR